MAEQNQNAPTVTQMTPEQRETLYNEKFGTNTELEKARATDLENISILIGRNHLESNNFRYGTNGSYAADRGYGDFMHSDYTRDLRRKLYGQEKDENKRLGIPDKPVITDYSLIKNATIAAKAAFDGMSIDGLEKLVAGHAPGSKVSESTYTPALVALNEKIKKNFIDTGKEYNPTQEEGEILAMEEGYREVLWNTFKEGTAKELEDQHYWDRTNSVLDEFYKKFQPKEQPKAEQQEQSEEENKSEEQN